MVRSYIDLNLNFHEYPSVFTAFDTAIITFKFQVVEWLLDSATRDAIEFRSGHESSDNLLLYNEC